MTNKLTYSILVVLLLLTLQSFAQIEDSNEQKITDIYTPPTFPNCITISDVDQKRKCTNNILQDFVIKHFNKKLFTNDQIKGFKVIKAEFVVTKQGKIKNISIEAPNLKIQNEIKRIIKKLPQMIPGKKEGKNINTKYLFPIILDFGHDKKENFFSNKKEGSPNNEVEVIEIDQRTDNVQIPTEQAISSNFLKNKPIYPGCKNADIQKTNECTNRKIQMFILQKLNRDITSELKLKGIVKMFSIFTVDKQGNIVNIGVRTPYKKLENEIIRVIKLLPKMTPGKMNGKAVNARFVLPIVIEIEE